VALCRDMVSPAREQECEADTASLDFLQYILDSEQPDFVAFTGDQSDGDAASNAKSVCRSND
jgi:hypothetical protein